LIYCRKDSSHLICDYTRSQEANAAKLAGRNAGDSRQQKKKKNEGKKEDVN